MTYRSDLSPDGVAPVPTMTDAQVGTLTKIREEYRPRIHEAANNLRATARDEVTEILGVIKR